MAIATRRDLEGAYSGLSTVAKPQHAGVVPGALFTETDTGSVYMYDGCCWTIDGGMNSNALLQAAVKLLNRIYHTLQATQAE